MHHGDWLDYIKDCEKLGFDTRKNSILFPEDFQNVHARLSEQVEVAVKQRKGGKDESYSRPLQS